MSDGIYQRVIELAAEIFAVPTHRLDRDTTPNDVESWDSVAQLNLLVALEDEYSIQFTSEDADRAHSLGAVAALVTERSA
jgi:acyl carrier protein